MIDRKWLEYYVDGNIEAEDQILKIALCRKYQEEYSDLQTVCKNAGLYPAEAEAIRKWKYHGRECYNNETGRLLDYIRWYEPERYDKALTIYGDKKFK